MANRVWKRSSKCLHVNATYFHKRNPCSSSNLQLALAHNGGAVRSHDLSGISDHLVNDGLGALPLVHDSGGLAHQERPCVVHGVLVHVVAHALNVPLDGDVALGGELLDLALSVLLPVLDVWVLAHSQRTAGKDDGANVVVKAGGSDGFLVGLGGSGFL